MDYKLTFNEKLFIFWIVLSIPIGFIFMCADTSLITNDMKQIVGALYTVMICLGFTYVTFLIIIIITKSIYIKVNIQNNEITKPRNKILSKQIQKRRIKRKTNIFKTKRYLHFSRVC